MAFGGPIFTATDALRNESLYYSYLLDSPIDTSAKKIEENNDRLKECANKRADKKCTNDKVKIFTKSEESSHSNELSKRAKRRRRRQKNLKSMKNLNATCSKNSRDQNMQDIKNTPQKHNEQGTTGSKKTLKKVLDKSKQTVVEPQTRATNNVSKLNKKITLIENTFSSNTENNTILSLFIAPVDLNINRKIKECKTPELNTNKDSQETKSDEQAHKNGETIESQNNKGPIWQQDPKIDKSFIVSEDEEADSEGNGGWLTVGRKQRIVRPYLSRYRYGSYPISDSSTDDEELNVLTDLQKHGYSFFTDNNNSYEFVFPNNNDNSQLLAEKNEQPESELFIGNKTIRNKAKSKNKEKIKTTEEVTADPLSHVHSQSFSNNACPQKQRTNQLNDLSKGDSWSLKKIAERGPKYGYKSAYNEDDMATYDVPERVLNDLKCGLCSEPLSYPPITLSADNGSVCGRCPTLEAENNTQPLREESYERVAGLFNFPCRYYPQGCMERLMMKNMANHEQCCTFKPYFCPVMPIGSCAWQGSTTELYGHFSVSHQVNVLENSVFELDIVNNYKELHLVPYLGQLFLLRTEFNCSDEIFRFSLHFVGSPMSAVKYEYELVFLAANEDRHWTHPKKPMDIDENLLNRKNECTVGLGYLKEILQTPTTIICRLRIKVTQEGVSEGMATLTLVDLEQNEYEDLNESYFLAEEEKEDFDDNEEEEEEEEEEDRDIKKRISDDVVDKMMLDMECPVCQDVMVPPIYQCVIGHSVCDTCKPKLKECPTCRNTIANTRNFTLERLSENLRYKCKNRNDGCTYETNSAGIRHHEGECKFNPIQCPLHNILNCDWLGKSSKILLHVKTKHPAHFHDNTVFTVSYNSLCVSDESMKVMRVHGEIFRIRFNYSNQMKQVSCTVQFTGASCEANRFMYEMHVMDMNNTGLQLMSKKYCGTLNDTIDDLKHCTMWHLDMVLPFASTDNLLKIHCVVTKV